MSEERRVINIDPASLKIPDHNKTRKKKEKPPAGQIKIKTKKPTKGPKPSTLKRSFLNMIRANQEQRLKKGTSRKADMVQEMSTPEPPAEPKSAFEESVQFLQSLPKTEKPKVSRPQPIQHHRTLKQAPIQSAFSSSTSSSPTWSRPSSPISTFPQIQHPIQPTSQMSQMSQMSPTSSMQPIHISTPDTNEKPALYIPSPAPPYGNLKNGNKPTFRTWRNNQTQRQNPVHIPRPLPKEVSPSPIQMNYQTQLREKIKTMSEREQKEERKVENMKKGGAMKKPKKQKRIVRRTYRIGKSKAHPRIGVLVSNKTLRNMTNLRKTQLKETPISEVKQFLRKQGFIKVGTTTPNDVLRQMYENVKMICGEVHNHNSDNLLYNYFNDIDNNSLEY